jgi:hypothetical protein
LINEAVPYTRDLAPATSATRLACLDLALQDMLFIHETYETKEFDSTIRKYGQKKAHEKTSSLFGKKLIMHIIYSLMGILFSCHQIGLILVSASWHRSTRKAIWVTQMHSKLHQTMAAILKTMTQDQSRKILYVHEEMKERRLAHGETIGKCDRNT